jgi:hypothetical protein
VSGVLLTTLGGGDAAADAGTGVAALGSVVVGGVLLVRARECAARQAEAEESRRAEQAEHARELAKRDARIDELAEEVTAMTDDSGVLRRQVDELRVRFDDEMSFRVRLESEFDQLAEWARGELGRASVTLEATRDQLEQALRRAAEAEAELTTRRAAAETEAEIEAEIEGEDVTADMVVGTDTTVEAVSAVSVDDVPSAELADDTRASDDTFVMARQALDLLWSSESLVAVSEMPQPSTTPGIPVSLAPGELSFEVAEPLPDAYLVERVDEAAACEEKHDAPCELGERLYRPFVLGVVAERTSEPAGTSQGDVTTAIDLTMYDETTEFSVRGLRSARHSA